MPSRDKQADRWRNIALTCFCATVIPLPLGVLLEGANVLHEGDTVRLARISHPIWARALSRLSGVGSLVESGSSGGERLGVSG